jgi:hypothetical protein
VTLSFFILSTVIPNNKLFFILCSLFIVIILLITKSFLTTIFLSYIPLSIFFIGQEYTFLAVSKEIIISNQYEKGRILGFIFSPHTVLLISIISSSIFLFFSEKFRKMNYTFLFLILLSLSIVISASKSYFFPTFSVVYALHSIGFVCFIIISSIRNNLLSKIDKLKLWRSLFFQISVSLIFISLISILQLIKTSHLGLNIESIESSPVYGVGADESRLIFRPTGLTPHANIMSNQVFILILTLLVVFMKINSKNKSKYLSYFFVGINLISILTIIISQSRSIYLGLLFVFLSILIFNYSFFKRVFSIVIDFFKHKPKFWMILLIFVIFIVGNRARYSVYSFAETGGFQVRRELVSETLSLIRKNPLFGVGKGMFIPALSAENPTGVISRFPESVHNGFLLFIAESGLVSQFILIIVVYFGFRRLYFSKYKNSLKVIIIISFIAQLVPMFFQPFINYLSVYTIFTLIAIFEE